MLASSRALRPAGGSSSGPGSAAPLTRSSNPLPLSLSRPRRMVALPVSATRGGRAGTTRSGTAVTTTTRGRPGTTATTTRSRSPPPPGTTRRAPSPPARRQQPPRPLSDAERNDPERGERGPGRGYFNFTGFPFPLGPYFERRTTRREIVKDTVWTFEQTQAIDFFAVYTPVRMTVVRLASTGGLWVHAPVAPTAECVRLLRELGAPVEHIVLPTFAYEHKVFVGPFSRRFPKAKVWVAPAQWSFPLNLPPQFFGIFPAGELCDFSEARAAGAVVEGEEEDDDGFEEEEDAASAPLGGLLAGLTGSSSGGGKQQRGRRRKAGAAANPTKNAAARSAASRPTLPPWSDEIDCKLLKPPQLSLSRDVIFSEAALFHRASRTLMVTDAVVYVPRDPPEVIPKWALLALGARDGFLATYLTGNRTKAQVAAEARTGPQGPDTPEARRLGWARMSLLVLYFQPFDLLTPQRSFEAISERLIVGPVVRTLVYSKIPRAVVSWVDGITSEWRFDKVVPCHFAGPVKAGPAEFREAFDFCYEAVEAREEEKRKRRELGAAGAAGAGGDGAADDEEEAEVEVAAESPASASGPGAFFAGLLAAVTGGGGDGKGAKRRAPARQLPPEDLGALRSLDSLLVRIGAVYPDAEDRADRAAAASGKGR